MCLDKKSINSFRLVNNDCKRITESPRILRALKVRMVSDIKGFLVSYDIFNYHCHSEGHCQIITLNADEWKNKLFKFLQDQSLNQVEVDHFKLLCKMIDENLYALVDSVRISCYFKELVVHDQMRLLENSWSEISILDQIHYQMYYHIPDETTLANGQKFELLSLAHLGTPSLLEAFNKISRKLATLMFDCADYVCLKLLLLLNPEVQTLRNQSPVQEFNEQVRQTLHEYCSYSRVPDKFNQLVNLLPDLRDMAQRGEDFLYFKHMQGHAPHHTLLMEMLLAKRNDSVSKNPQ